MTTRALLLGLLLACCAAPDDAATAPRRPQAVPPIDLRGDRPIAPVPAATAPAPAVEPAVEPVIGPVVDTVVDRGTEPTPAPTAPRTDATAAGAEHLARGADLGWTVFRPSADARIVYVSSSSGDDAADGLAPERARRTIAAGKALLRHGFPDWLLLRRGDRFDEPLGQWLAGGRSREEPLVVASFGDGDERPRIHAAGDGLVTGAFGRSPRRIDHVAFVGLHLVAERAQGGADTPYGIVWRLPGEDLLLEDCVVEGFFQNVVLEPLDGRARDVRVRRSIVVDGYTTGPGHAQGLYAHAVDGLLLEENLFWHNGWRAGLAGAEPTIFRHNVYVQVENTGVRAHGNVIAEAGSHGLQMRSGGEASGNLFLRNPIALMLGNKTGDAVEPVLAERNVVLDGADIGPEAPRGWGIEVVAAPRGRIAGNLVANQRGGTFPLAMNLFADRQNRDGVHELAIEDNAFVDWGGPILVQGAPPLVDGIALARNLVRDGGRAQCLIEVADAGGLAALDASRNRLELAGSARDAWIRVGGANVPAGAWGERFGADAFRDGAPEPADPGRSAAGYLASLDPAAEVPPGPEGERAFLEALRGQSRARWRPELTAARVNAWIRAGLEPARDD